MRVLQAPPDRGRSQGKCYSLTLILSCVVLAILAGEKTMVMAEFVLLSTE